MNHKLKVKQIVIAAGLAAISTITQLIHIGYQSPQFGMWIDVVAISWLIAFFLFGTRLAFLVSVVGAVMITLFAPDTWLGASMKWVATAPMWLSLALWILVLKKPLSQYKSILFLTIPVLIALIIRCLIIIPLNYYYAIPIWTGLTTAKAMVIIPWYIIALFNVIQGLIDVYLAWALVYVFKLNRFSQKESYEK